MKAEEVDIIDNYSRLSIGLYGAVLKADRDDTLDEVDKQVRIISLLSDISEDELLNMPITDYSLLAARIAFLHREVELSPIAQSYLVGGFDLVPVTDMRKITTAQYIDFQSFHKAGLEDHFAEVLSCLLVPRGCKYAQDYDVAEVQEAIRKNMSVREGCSLYAFFLVSSRESIRDILTFSRSEAKQIKDKGKREELLTMISQQMNLLRNGNGSPM